MSRTGTVNGQDYSDELERSSMLDPSQAVTLLPSFSAALLADYPSGLMVPDALQFKIFTSCIALRRFKSDVPFGG